jgi:hypothetical protein
MHLLKYNNNNNNNFVCPAHCMNFMTQKTLRRCLRTKGHLTRIHQYVHPFYDESAVVIPWPGYKLYQGVLVCTAFRGL